MLLFAGLGNPGPEYSRNRHNIGFMALDAIAREHRFGPFRSKFQGLASEGLIGGERVLLLKPQTFMNESGRAVGEAARFVKIPRPRYNPPVSTNRRGTHAWHLMTQDWT